jgi:endonuclease YncB( thermonuclease family)
LCSSCADLLSVCTLMLDHARAGGGVLEHGGRNSEDALKSLLRGTAPGCPDGDTPTTHHSTMPGPIQSRAPSKTSVAESSYAGAPRNFWRARPRPKWRLANVDTPEITSPRCTGEFRKALAARDLLQQFMRQGYTLHWQGRTEAYGRQLVRITLADGRDAGDALVAAGLARRWPYDRAIWCKS